MKAAYFPIAKHASFQEPVLSYFSFHLFFNSQCLQLFLSQIKWLSAFLKIMAIPPVIGSGAAPYINQLAGMGANMVEFYALTHPSQPELYFVILGENQGVTTDAVPSGTPGQNLTWELP